MVDVRYLAAGGVIAAIAAYVYLSSGGGDVFAGGGAATSPGGYVAGDIPASGAGDGGGTTYVFPAEVPPTFPAAGTPIDWSTLFGTGSFFDDPVTVADAKKTATVSGGARAIGAGAGFGGGGAGGTVAPAATTVRAAERLAALPVPVTAPGGGILDTLASYLKGFGSVFSLASPVAAAASYGTGLGTSVGDLLTGAPSQGAVVGGRSGDEVMGAMTTSKKALAVSANGGKDSVAASVPMSEDVAEFLSAGVGGAAKKTATTSGGGAVYTHSSGARSIVTGGQITGGTSRALDAWDIARLSASQRTALGY